MYIDRIHIHLSGCSGVEWKRLRDVLCNKIFVVDNTGDIVYKTTKLVIKMIWNFYKSHPKELCPQVSAI